MKQATMRLLALTLALILLGVGLVGCAKEPANEENAGVFAVKVNGVTVELGKSAAPILEKLGEPLSEDEVFDCGEGNSRTKYRYGSMTLYVMKSGKDAVVDQIELEDDLAETTRGICIGDSESAVREAYGEPSAQSSGSLRYVKDSMQIEFDLTDGTVSGIGLLRKTK